MPVTRRRLLGLGAAVTASLVTSACREAGPDVGATTTSPSPRSPARVTPRVVPGPARPAFAGQPPPGSLYYGASVPYHQSLSAWETELGSSLALNRSYFTPDHNERDQLVNRCHDDLAHGRLPHVSIKPPGTWHDVASGVRDAWLSDVLRPLGRSAGPIFLTLHHEPEDDAGPVGMQPADYVAMQRRAISSAAALAPQVTIVPVLQDWTFDPSRHDIDPSGWIVPDASVLGLDIYNPWSPTNRKPWRTFGSKVDEVIDWFGGRPLVIGEYGCREDPDVPGLAANWLRDAVDYARTHNIVSMSYFNSAVGAEDGSWELKGQTEQTFAELLAQDWVVRPA